MDRPVRIGCASAVPQAAANNTQNTPKVVCASFAKEGIAERLFCRAAPGEYTFSFPPPIRCPGVIVDPLPSNIWTCYEVIMTRDKQRSQCMAAILAHNHPSGVAEPSHADQLLTQSLKQALALVDIKVLDHFIVAGGSALSFAERGLL